MSDNDDFQIEEIMAQALSPAGETETEQTLNVNVRIEIEFVE